MFFNYKLNANIPPDKVAREIPYVSVVGIIQHRKSSEKLVAIVMA